MPNDEKSANWKKLWGDGNPQAGYRDVQQEALEEMRGDIDPDQADERPPEPDEEEGPSLKSKPKPILKIASTILSPIETIKKLYTRYGLAKASTITELPQDWLWENYIPFGEITMLDGDPEAGKTTLLMDIVARATRGQPFPGSSQALPPMNVAYLTGEDSAQRTIVKRLRAAGADMDRVTLQLLAKQSLVFPRCTDDMHTMISAEQIRLLIMDTISIYLDSSKINMNNEQDVRAALLPLRQVVDEENISVVATRHFSKASGDKPALYRGIGSIAFAALARSVLLLIQHPADLDLRVLASQKCNLAIRQDRPSRGFNIVGPKERPRVRWLPGTIDTSIDDLLGLKPPGRPQAERLKAKAFLKSQLAAGPVDAAQIIQTAQASGISQRSIERAAQEITVSIPTGVGKEVQWELKDPPTD